MLKHGEARKANEFSQEEKSGLYAAIFGRRDIRAFHPDPVPDDVLVRILNAAHHAPSVGFMQPWDFILIRDPETRRRIKELSDRERQAAAVFFDEPRRSKYLSMKLEGILDAPLNLCVTCDPRRPAGPGPQQYPRDRRVQHLSRRPEPVARGPCRGRWRRVGKHPA